MRAGVRSMVVVVVVGAVSAMVRVVIIVVRRGVVGFVLVVMLPSSRPAGRAEESQVALDAESASRCDPQGNGS